MHVQNLVKFCRFILKVLSENKFRRISKAITQVNVRKMMCNNPDPDIVISMHIQNLAKFYDFVLKIMSGKEIMNEILISIKDHNSLTNASK